MHQAYLLHRRPYSNSSMLVECFTNDLGRFPAIAKGVRSGRGVGVAVLQPFRPLTINVSGKGEVKTLTGFEQTSPESELKGKALYSGFYLNELLMRLLARNDPHERLFWIYQQTLERLHIVQQLEMTLRRFELGLLNELGYGLVLTQDVETGADIEREKLYFYELERGPIKVAQGNSNVVRGSTLLALAGNDTMDRVEQREARGLMRRVLSHYLGDTPLKSRELFGKPK